MAVIRLPSFDSAVLRRSGTTVSAIAGTLPPLHKLDTTVVTSPGKGIYRRKYVVRIPFIGSRDRKRVAQTLNAIRAAFILAWPKIQFGLQPNKGNLDALSAYIQLCNWILQTWTSRGEQYVATRLKSLCDHLRFDAVPVSEQLGEAPSLPSGVPWTLDGRFDATWLFRGSIRAKAYATKPKLRFSRASRAFPAGGVWSQEQAIQKHRIAMFSTPTTPAEILDCVKRVVKRVVGDSLRSVPEQPVSLSSAASLETTVKEGGAAAHVRLRVWRQEYLEGYEPEYELAVVDGLPHESPLIHRLARLSAIEDAFPTGKIERVIPSHRIVPIPDRGGFKTRVISAGPASLQLLAHDIRKVLYRRVLSKTPTLWALRQDGVKEWIRNLRIPPNAERAYLGDWVVLSSDLSAATDRFPHDIVEAVNDQIEANGFDPAVLPQWIAWRSLSGPQKIIYKDELPVTTSCGNLMGTAPSWFHLNMINLSAIRVAWAIWSSPPLRRRFPELVSCSPIQSVISSDLIDRTRRSIRDLRNVFAFPRGYKLNELTAIIGDDLCAACPFAVAVLYEVILRECNAVLSPGKHYVQPWSDGNLLLVAEEFAIVEGDRLVSVVAEHLRGLIAIAESRDFCSADRPEMWSQVGSNISTALRDCRPTLYKPLCSIAHMHLYELRRTLLSAGLPVYLPTSVGGLGWPHPKGLRYALERTAITCLHTYSRIRGLRNNPLEFAIAISRIRYCWKASSSARHYSELASLFRAYSAHWQFSRDSCGRLAPLTPDTQLGLKTDQVECLPLSDVIDVFCGSGVTARYLTDLGDIDAEDSEATFRGISNARRRYKRLCLEIQGVRRGFRPPRMPRSNYADLIREDEELLASLYVNLNAKELADLVPSLLEFTGKEPESTQDSLQEIGISDTN